MGLSFRTHGRLKVFLFVILMASAGALAFFWRESRTTGLLASVLMEDIRSFMLDASTLLDDPLLAYALGSDNPFASRVKLQRALATEVAGRFSAFHLSPEFRTDLAALSKLDSRTLDTYLHALEAWQRSLHTPPAGPVDLDQAAGTASADSGAKSAPPPVRWRALSEEALPPLSNPVLLRQKFVEIAQADREKVEKARALVPELKPEWEHDTQVYCRATVAMRRLAELQEVQRRGCPSCAKGAISKFQAQIDQLEQIRDLNERKLKLKWGELLSARVRCL
jgi:hypothetical protein